MAPTLCISDFGIDGRSIKNCEKAVLFSLSMDEVEIASRSFLNHFS